MKVFVCSPLRGRDGQPSPTNIALTRRLMKAVFDAGGAPFAPHLLYPQILSESEADLRVAFAANIAWLTASNEIWVWARKLEECTAGMKLEVDGPGIRWRPKVVWMPAAFQDVEKEGWKAETRTQAGVVPAHGAEQYLKGLSIKPAAPEFRPHGPVGTCARCDRSGLELDRAGWCFDCFIAFPVPA